MKFLLDANVRHSVGIFLESEGHDVRYLAGTADQSLADEEVLTLANDEERILMTGDRDFGRLVFVQGQPHSGVVYLRLIVESKEYYKQKIQELLTHYGDRLVGHFVVLSDEHIRFR